jgi:hypothetical protein
VTLEKLKKCKKWQFSVVWHFSVADQDGRLGQHTTSGQSVWQL